ncbi:hypothetical protein [Coraliomargarita parva]|uniref:hypothetical protein n=1 Tax=Coraliomargarita parva TaxID=3014050 RepID=UPI0022B40BB7|nr:hypothetical protein [Coraliomargarita parva]
MPDAPEKDPNVPYSVIAVVPGLSPKQVEDSILRAASGRKWTVQDVKPGEVTIRLMHRGYDATLVFKYDGEKVEVFSDSWRINREGEKTRRKDPVGWIENLEKDIPVFMVRVRSAGS